MFLMAISTPKPARWSSPSVPNRLHGAAWGQLASSMGRTAYVRGTPPVGPRHRQNQSAERHSRKATHLGHNGSSGSNDRRPPDELRLSWHPWHMLGKGSLR